jgi:hypothetical protein
LIHTITFGLCIVNKYVKNYIKIQIWYNFLNLVSVTSLEQDPEYLSQLFRRQNTVDANHDKILTEFLSNFHSSIDIHYTYAHDGSAAFKEEVRRMRTHICKLRRLSFDSAGNAA